MTKWPTTIQTHRLGEFRLTLTLVIVVALAGCSSRTITSDKASAPPSMATIDTTTTTTDPIPPTPATADDNIKPSTSSPTSSTVTTSDTSGSNSVTHRTIILTTDGKVVDLADSETRDLCGDWCRTLRDPSMSFRSDGAVVIGPACEIRADCFLLLTPTAVNLLTVGPFQPIASELSYGRSWVVQLLGQTVAFFPPDTGVPRQGVPFPLYGGPISYIQVDWVPETNRLVVLTLSNEGQSDLWTIDVDQLQEPPATGATTEIPKTFNGRAGVELLATASAGKTWSNLAVSPDNATVVETNASGDIVQLDIGLTNGVAQSSTSFATAVVDTDYSNDGSVFVFVDAAGNVWQRDETGEVQIASNALRVAVG